MSDWLLPRNWWETSAFGGSTLPFGDDDGWEDLDGDLELFLTIEELLTGQRKSFWEHRRLDWERHVQKLLHEDRFHIRYRMPLEDFEALVELLGDSVVPNVAQSKRRCQEPMYPKMIVAIGIRVLAGGNYDDIMNTFGISKSGFYYSRNRFLNAVLSSNELDINLPATPDDWENVRSGFAAKSANRVLKGCVGALDGFFQPTMCPTVKESCGFPRSYYSGHYQSYGLNCQAMCDSRLRFLLFTVIAPGQTNDAVAYEETGLHEILNELPSGLYVAGDAAYILTEHLLVPFTGSCRLDLDKDSYNFYLSQLRIRIEMSFGLLTTKWRCLRKKLETTLVNSAKIIEACARMHNYVLDCKIEKEEVEPGEKDEAEHEIHVMPDSPLGWGYLPTIEVFHSLPGTSLTREAVVRKIARGGFRRPAHNLERRRLELYDVGLM
jgi:hypothetical protein